MSWQLRLINAQLRRLVKPRLRRLSVPERARAELDLAAKILFRAPPMLRHVVRDGGLHWIGVGHTPVAPILLYFHGGGYIAGTPEAYEGMLGRLSVMTGLDVCAPAYRLAPEHPAPAAFEDAQQAWRALERLGYRPDQIVLGGDSAGGGLALALLSWLCQTGRVPAAAFFFSPWTDLAMTGESLALNKEADPIFPVQQLHTLCDFVLQGFDPKDPRISPLYADFPGCPPVLIHWGRDELLKDDSTRMAVRLRGFGAPVEMREFEDVAHGWQLWDGWQPEARESLQAAATFAQTALADTTR